MSLSKRAMFEEMEADFCAEVFAAYEDGALVIDDDGVECPACGEHMDFIEHFRHGRIRAIAIQFHCDNCGGGTFPPTAED